MTISAMIDATTSETIHGYERPKKKYPSKNFVMVHIASLPSRIDETNAMCPHMKSARTSPDALWTRSSRAGQ